MNSVHGPGPTPPAHSSYGAPEDADDARDSKKAALKARRRASKAARRAAAGLSARAPRFGARNENRAAVFVKFLVETFGVERLRREGVCDVAGGRGEITCRLAHCHEVRCVLVEPREAVDLQATVLKRVAPRLPARYRRHLEEAGRSERIERLATVVESPFPPRDAANAALVAGCGIWVGLHADGATEAIVEEALRARKAFAVVPCCVFPRFFATRATEDGRPVRTTADLVSYLAAKDARTCTTTLAFEGKNCVVSCDASAVRVAAGPADVSSAVLANEPILIEDSAATWRATRSWTADGKLVVQNVERDLGDRVAPVVAGNGARTTMRIREFLTTLHDEGTGYLKDFHLHRASPGWYAPPPGLDDDWLNRFCDREGRDDFRFLYLGGDGSRTPLHADVLASHSWSANICGAKEWWLFPPSETSKLQDAAGVYVDDVRLGFYDSERFPRVADAACLRVTQPPRSTLFVPSDWRHMVVNVGATLSINHNWFEAGAIPNVWRYLDTEARATAAELEACRADVEGRGGELSEFLWLRERVLRASARLNVSDFVAMCRSEVCARDTLAPAGSAPEDERRVRDGVRLALRAVATDHAGSLFLDESGTWPRDEDATSWSRSARDRGAAALAEALAALEPEDVLSQRI